MNWPKLQASDKNLLKLGFMISMWQVMFIVIFLLFLGSIGRFTCIAKNHKCPGEGCPGITEHLQK